MKGGGGAERPIRAVHRPIAVKAPGVPADLKMCHRSRHTTNEAAPPPHVSEADQKAALAEVRSTARGVVPMAIGFNLLILFGAGLAATIGAPRLDGMALILVVGVITLAVELPVIVLMSNRAMDRSALNLAESKVRERAMTEDAHRREFETRLGNALEMAANEWEVLSVAGRALKAIAGEDRVEILLADNSNAHLERALVSGSDPDGPACSVQSPGQCVAARRGQTQVFADSEAIDACPHLHGRDYGRCAAVCVPVSIMGRTTGVVHWAGPTAERLEASKVNQLEVLANQTGARVGMIRVVSESQLQATTDHLTGLINRRAFEAKVRALQHDDVSFSLVMADLDHFKELNDTHGHDAGDRALRVFVSVLKSTLRPGDLACRYGGEEFVLALPNCDGFEATKICARIREALALAGLDGSVPTFTCSFGVAPPRPESSLQDLVAEADAALYEAKNSGRDRSVMLDIPRRAEAEVEAAARAAADRVAERFN